MGVARKHGLYAIGVGSTLLGGITQQSLATGSEIRGDRTSGDIYARFQAMVSQNVAPSFSTLAIATALSACGTLGASLASLTGGLALYAQKHQSGGTRSAGASHRKFAFTSGILAPQQLTVNHRGDASLTYQALVVSADGVNAPIAITDSVTLPTNPSGEQERFTLGPVSVAGITLTQIRSLTIDFGIALVGDGADSDLWDTLASISDVTPSIRMSGSDVEWLKESGGIPLAGAAAAHADTEIYLRKRADRSTFVASATEAHIKITGHGCAYIDQAFSASGNDGSESSLVIPLAYDGTNAPLVIDTAAAIS